MGPIRATFGRTVARARGFLSTGFAVSSFLAISGLLFVRGLETAEGGASSIALVWASSVSVVLPALAALLGMEVWSDERMSRRIDLLLSVAVVERDFVIGKFLGAYAILLTSIGLSLVGTIAVLRFLLPSVFGGLALSSFLLAVFALALQGALWTAVSVAASALFRHAAAAACAAAIVLIGLPRGLWAGFMSWSESGSIAFGEMPLDAHVVDIVSGLLPIGTMIGYGVLTVLALFVATRFVVAYRLVGRGALRLRVTNAFVVALALVLAGLFVALLARLNPLVDLGARSADGVSLRTQNLLLESSGDLTITAFLPRKDPAFRPIGRILRALQAKSEAIGGARVELRFVDPNWNLGAADRLVRRGIDKNSLVFESGRRITTVAVKDGYDERICASAIRRVVAPPRRQKIYWTTGHGENRYDDYGDFGMSDIARDLFQEGYAHATLDLLSGQAIPPDCALILIAGARDDFSRVETDRLNAYLREGGRLMALQGPMRTGGIAALLPSWGVTPFDRPFVGVATLSGSDVIVSDFSEHPITAPLKGSRVILDRPVAFEPSAVAGSGNGVDKVAYTAVAKADSTAVVVAAERGGGVGNDLAIRPTRLVVIGDASFAINGQLTARASANRDFFLNCVSYLSGSEAYGSGGTADEILRTGMDRHTRLRMTLVACICLPVVVFLVMALVAVRRRHRS